MKERSAVALRLNDADSDFDARFDAYAKRERGDAEDVREAVAAIIAEVRADGVNALEALTQRFDGFSLAQKGLRVTAEEIDAALGACDPQDLAALRFAAARIEDFHRRQLPQDHQSTDESGVFLGWRWTPVDAAGLYAPGGRAVYPSSVLMNAIPARVAGVERLAMVCPTPGGTDNPLLLAAARIAGVDEIYRIGGAQAIAALSFGAGPIAPVDLIVGPGNAYVAEAKRQVFGAVGIDAIAGPSEILVVSDAANEPSWMAADLLSQAEHDPSSQSVLITDDAGFADRVATQIDRQLAQSPRREIAAAAWRDHGAVIVLRTLSDAPRLIDALAPEHLELAIAEPETLAARVRHAGAIFLGRFAPEAIGDYVAGPDHVLPTSRAARFSSGLSTLSFMKRTTLIGADREALQKIGPAAARLADAEGLPAHAASVRLRLREDR